MNFTHYHKGDNMNEVTVMTDDLRIKRRPLMYGGYFAVPYYGTIDRDLFDRMMEYQTDVPPGLSLKEAVDLTSKKMKALSTCSAVYQFNAKFKGIHDEYVRMAVFLGGASTGYDVRLREITKLDTYKWKALSSVCSVLNFVTKPLNFMMGVKR